MKEVITKSLEETFALAEEFVEGLLPQKEQATLVLLEGNLGSGKTAFTKGIAKALGIDDPVTSPTFVIQKIYSLQDQKFERLIHIDAYRLENGEELLPLGWSETLSDPDNLICLEWPELVESALPDETQTLHFEFVDENTRQIKFQAPNDK